MNNEYNKENFTEYKNTVRNIKNGMSEPTKLETSVTFKPDYVLNGQNISKGGLENKRQEENLDPKQ